MTPLSKHFTYANVVATLALFLVVAGGGAYAASQLAKNSVGSKQLKKNAVTTAKIKNRAVKGAKIDLASLGTVPSAADSRTLQGMSPAEISATAKLSCPAGTAMVANLCFETSRRDAAKWESAAKDCADAGRLLPSPAQLAAYDIAVNNSVGEWTDAVFSSGGTKAMQMTLTKGGSAYFASDINSLVPFRCVISPGN